VAKGLGVDFERDLSWQEQHLEHNFLVWAKVARFFLVQHTKTENSVPNDHKIDQRVIKFTKKIQMTYNIIYF
jgi:hypothetical protein